MPLFATIIIVMILALAVLVAVGLFARASIALTWDSLVSTQLGPIHFSWLHQWFLRGWYDPGTKQYEVFILGFFRVKSTGESMPDEEEPQAHETPRREEPSPFPTDNPTVWDVSGSKGLIDTYPPLAQSEPPPHIPASKPSDHSSHDSETSFAPRAPKAPPRQHHHPRRRSSDYKSARVPDNADDQQERPRESWLHKIKKNRWFFLARQTGCYHMYLDWIVRLVRTALRLIRFESVKVTISANLGDPAQTGMVGGWLMSARELLIATGSGRIDIQFVPLFDREGIESTGSVKIVSSVWRLIAPVVVALVTFPYITTLYLWWASRRYVRTFSAQQKPARAGKVSPARS